MAELSFRYSPGAKLVLEIGALEAAAAGHPQVQKEHLMIGLCKAGEVLAARPPDADVAAEPAGLASARQDVEGVAGFLKESGLDAVHLRRRVRHLVGRGSAPGTAIDPRASPPSTTLEPVLAKAERLAAGEGSSELTARHLLIALLDNPGPRIAQAVTAGGGDVEALAQAVVALARPRAGEGPVAAPARPSPPVAPTPLAGYLGRFGVDLTALARAGEIEPLIGRRKELLQVIRTLTRRTKNNPVLLGDPGVGKTAVVRGLAQRIAAAEITGGLKGKTIIELRLGSIVAGTRLRGECEERLTRIVEEARSRPDVILFLDEIHTLVGAGGPEGGLDAANILKPSLSSGEIRCIGASTLVEYRKHFEKDAALARRFQPVVVEEPSADEALGILRGLRERYEKHHGVRIEDDAISSAVQLSTRYLPDRRLPDKALDLLDEACSRAKIGTISLQDAAAAQQGEGVAVTGDTVAQVLTDWTGIPVGRLDAASRTGLREIEAFLKQRVIGQDDAVRRVAHVVRTARTGLRDARRPVGVFLFLGPTGVGKTELCRALAEFLFESDKQLVRLDMSEYLEKHNVSRLIGAPPGYVGYDEEGQLTGALRRRPHSVVLFDEIEKAHPAVFDLFLQLFDEGRLTDSHGRTADGRHAIFVMTSNLVGGEAQVGFAATRMDSVSDVASANLSAKAPPELKRVFRPEFLNRIDEIISFVPLGGDVVERIARKLLDELGRRARDQGVTLEWDDAALAVIARDGYDPAYGARPLARVVERMVARPLSEKMVNGDVRPGDTVRIVAGTRGVRLTRAGDAGG